MSPEALLVFIDVLTTGIQREHFVVPDISFCAQQTVQGTCTSLEYNINFTVDTCVAPASARVIHDGRTIPIAIEETGQKGRAGYSWTLRTTEIFAGDADVEITTEAISGCNPAAHSQLRSPA